MVTFPRTGKNSSGRRSIHAVSRGRVCWCLLVSEDMKGRVSGSGEKGEEEKEMYILVVISGSDVYGTVSKPMTLVYYLEIYV